MPRFADRAAARGKMTFETSAPHRILTIALRRGALEGIDTIDELFGSKQRFIRIKNEFIDKPILLAGGKRGLSVQQDQPMRSQALTEYLKLGGQKAGFAEATTFYRIRRNTAQGLQSHIDADATRAIMVHGPTSTVLEEYYAHERTELVNLTALAPGENASAPADKDLSSNG